ncbi:unnamed protein product [Ascophyllum nodosum]
MSGLAGGGGGGMNATLNSLLEKTSNWDKDERYMATNDLCNELQKDIKIDATMERRICTAVLRQLDDSSNDVQTIAVKCLGALLRKVQEAQVGEICDKLCDLILDGKAELRDIYSIGLKTLISDVPDAFGASVAQRLTVRLLGGVEQEATMDIKLECLDNLTDLLKRFGREVESEHERIMTVVLKQLPHERVVVRKRAATCLGSIAVVVSESLLNRLAVHLLQKIAESPQPDVVRTLIQTIGTISRTVGYRLGRHLDSIVPLFLKFCGDPEDESQHTEAADELRENCFQGFESFVVRCPREVTPHLSRIINVALQYIKYDPNYSYGDEDEGNGDEDVDMDAEEEEEEFSDEEGGASDDDDTSWKVRRSAIKVLKAVIECRSELPKGLYDTCCDELIARFKEREENVRTDVVGCFAKLLEAAFAAGAGAPMSMSMSMSRPVPGRGGLVRHESGGHQQHHHYYFPAHPPEAPIQMEERQRIAVASLKSKLGAIVKASDKQLKGKSHKTIVAVFQMLRTLCLVLGGGLEDHMPGLIESSHRCLQDKNQSLKLEALLFLRLSMEKHPPYVFHLTIRETIKYVTPCVKEDWYKIIAEELRVVGNIVKIIRPLPAEDNAMGDDFAYQPLVKPLYNAIFPRLSAHDIDQEIKECAITSMGLLLAHLASELTAELPEVLGLLMDRLGNEMTRMATLKALASISVSPRKVNLEPILPSATEELALFLRQQSRPLKQTTLETLLALIGSNHRQMSQHLFSLLVKEASSLINHADLHLAYLSLKMSCLILEVSPKSAEAVRSHVLPRALELSTSPLLQGLALASLLSLFRVLVTINHRGMGFDDLLVALQNAVAREGDRLPKQAVANVASRCMAVLCAQTNDVARSKTVARFVKDMQGNDEQRKHLGLLVVGELGRQSDLSSVKNLQEIILRRFEGGSEETKTAAAYSLGHVCVGNMKMYLPGILSAFMKSVKHQYLLLSSLKEVIVCHANTEGLDFSPYVDQVLPHLFKHCTSEEEGVRNMVAECLGALTCMHPKRLIPDLMELPGWTRATSLKYCMAGKAPAEALAPHMERCLGMLHDDDLDVKKAALLMVNAAVHHQPFLVSELLPKLVIPALYETIELKLERTVDLGPFKHKVDDGEPLRKAALSCIDTILDNLPNRLDVGILMPYLAKGMGDSKSDVQMLCHQIVAKLSEYSPGGVLGSLDAVIEPLEKTCTKQVKAGQVGTEVDRANDLIRSALRCVVAISRIDDVEVSRKFTEFMDRIHRKERLVNMMATIKSERTLDG